MRVVPAPCQARVPLLITPRVCLLWVPQIAPGISGLVESILGVKNRYGASVLNFHQRPGNKLASAIASLQHLSSSVKESVIQALYDVKPVTEFSDSSLEALIQFRAFPARGAFPCAFVAVSRQPGAHVDPVSPRGARRPRTGVLK
ncbi:hypothetical protein NDU88_001486 [Pleurodeles waltl]|uniref:RNase H type-1 domain-containing protein n=1 Tax=Pleurodeles waltl TaxID=8319 RepID=A0AAV7S9W8_PLEWA|nr:hypothetical protein NDU88_001486 [Pleurodeles waltl]